MADNKGGVRRYGVRYGTTIRQRLSEAESTQKRSYECPKCKQKKVKRVSAGIWLCRKCGTKFAGGAYSVSKKIKIKEEIISAEGKAPIKRRRLKRKEAEELETENQEEQ